MTDQTEYQTNRDLFSNHYLTDTLRDREPWNEVSDEEVREAYEEISDLVDSKIDRVEDYNEAQLERNLIRPIFDILDIPFEIEETVMRNARRPDYGFFPSDEAADAAFDRKDFYEESIAVADAKRWGRKLDTRGEEKRDFENPSYQIHRYLQETPTQWAVLTNGAQWRLYYEPTSHRLDSYYEIDLPAILDTVAEEDGIGSFKYFYLFFRQEAFLPDQTGDCFLDDVYNKSNVFAEELGEDLQENIYEAIRVLAEGFIETNEELDEADLNLIHDSSLIYLYRLIFVLYAESEGRNLLPTNNDIYSSSYSLNQLKQTVVERRSETQQHYQTWQTDLWDRLNELFVLIDQGSQGHNIPKEDLYIPAYNGGLFRTDPDQGDSDEAQFLASNEVGDEYIAEVIELLTRHETSEGDGKVFVDYSSLDERHLGSIYEGLLEYKLDVADEPLTVEDGEYSIAEDDDDVAVQRGDVYLRTDDGERKATGSYYTPEYVVEYIVDETLGSIVDDIREDMLAESARGEEQRFAEEFAEQIFDLNLLDPAMGSGHFLVNAVDYLAREIIDAQQQQDRQAAESEQDEVRSPTTEDGELRDINWARRKIAQKCIYGVDINGLATELSKVSLWLRTLAAEQPLAFLDHHLKTGNSLVGSDITAVLSDDNGDNDGQLTLTQSFARARQETLGHVMNLMKDLLAIDNDELEDIKSMEGLYDKIQDDPLYVRLFEIANVHTAEQFGLDVPEDVYEKMAGAIDDGDAWEEIRSKDWFASAQETAEEQSFFHWELEYPEVFFGEDGEKRNDAGFDAVVGNPPYGMVTAENEAKYYRAKYKSAEGRPERYAFFTEKAYNLSRYEGFYGYIVSNTILSNELDEKIRELILENSEVQSIVLYNDSVFDDPTVHPVTITGRRAQPSEDHEVSVITGATPSGTDGTKQRYVKQNRWRENTGHTISIISNPEQAEIWWKMQESNVNLGDMAHIRQCIKTGDNNKYLKKSETKLESPWKPVLTGSDIGRYSIEWPNRYLKYGDWLARNWKNKDFYEREKICIRETSDRITAALDEENRYLLSTLYSVYYKDSHSGDLKYLIGIINSNLAQFFMYHLVFSMNEGDFTKARTNHYERLPIVTDEDEISISDTDQGIPELVEDITSAKEQKSKLNLNPLDHLGSYSDGQSLAEIGFTQPPAGAADSILQETGETYPNLKVGSVEVVRESSSTVEIQLTARYKPDDEEEYETDQWGYTETELLPALQITELSETEADLISAFVPVAVDEAGGFAGFRESVTKTNSLIDRLQKLTLPSIADVETGLEQYRETKQRADELEDKIQRTDDLIDEIVYELYGLTDEEIEIVEEAVADD